MLLSFQIRILFCRLILFPNINISESTIRLHSIEILNVQNRLSELGFYSGEIDASNSPTGGAVIQIKFPKKYN